jgi:hypothetical protein
MHVRKQAGWLGIHELLDSRHWVCSQERATVPRTLYFVNTGTGKSMRPKYWTPEANFMVRW